MKRIGNFVRVLVWGILVTLGGNIWLSSCTFLTGYTVRQDAMGSTNTFTTTVYSAGRPVKVWSDCTDSITPAKAKARRAQADSLIKCLRGK
jgi:hypothetical protein